MYSQAPTHSNYSRGPAGKSINSISFPAHYPRPRAQALCAATLILVPLDRARLFKGRSLMKARAAKLVFGAEILLLALLVAEPSRAQAADAMLSRNDRNPASISQSTAIQTEAIVFYNLSSLTPGDYEMSPSADGFARSRPRWRSR